MIAAAEDPGFLRTERVPLDEFAAELIGRWRPTAPRESKLGRLDAATVPADAERLGLAMDALLENAIRHPCDGDLIQLSVTGENGPDFVKLVRPAWLPDERESVAEVRWWRVLGGRSVPAGAAPQDPAQGWQRARWVAWKARAAGWVAGTSRARERPVRRGALRHNRAHDG